MNREIKFRGQRVDNREWVTGDLCKSISGAPCIMPTAFFATREFEEQEDNEPQVISDSLAIGGFYPVKPETVGQQTGLKDKNGVEIFEGDVSMYKGAKGFVFYDDNTAMFMVRFPLLRSVYSFDSINGELEVIGNIYSNLELLK